MASWKSLIYQHQGIRYIAREPTMEIAMTEQIFFLAEISSYISFIKKIVTVSEWVSEGLMAH